LRGSSFGATSLRPAVQAARTYTDQQRAIIETQADIVMVEAYAGTANTTTAVGFSSEQAKSTGPSAGCEKSTLSDRS